MKNLLRKAANASLAKVVREIREPWRRELSQSPIHTPIDAIRVLFPQAASNSVEEYQMTFLKNEAFYAAINRNFVERRRRRALPQPWDLFLYLTVRLVRPRIMIETGVFDGYSTSVILQAMRDNNAGTLISIDLPATDEIAGSTDRMAEVTLPPGCQPGWVIPAQLKDRHRLLLGDSRTLLPSALAEESNIDIFFHDSLHTLDHMLFEYALAWPKLSEHGVLLSDDISWSAAMLVFCRQVGRPLLRVSGDFGAIRK